MDETYVCKAALIDRLHKGGENMPAFSQLNDEEIHLLLAYVKHLAAVPGAADEQSVIKEPHARVGELIVKSTCHTCHSATGPDPSPQELASGAIPPLSTLAARKDQSEFIRKVTQGAPVLMGTPPTLYRGRMPVFFYLTQEEAADVYLYLTLYPPTKPTDASAPVAASLGSKPPSDKGSGLPPPDVVANDVPGDADETSNRAEFEWLAVLLTVALVTLVLVSGLIFTLREFKRLSPEDTDHRQARRPLRAELAPSSQRETIERTQGALLYSGAKRSSQ